MDPLGRVVVEPLPQATAAFATAAFEVKVVPKARRAWTR
jgi:hypothetical protein